MRVSDYVAPRIALWYKTVSAAIIIIIKMIIIISCNLNEVHIQMHFAALHCTAGRHCIFKTNSKLIVRSSFLLTLFRAGPLAVSKVQGEGGQ